MGTLLRIDVLSVEETAREHPSWDPQYALWLYLDAQQSSFIEVKEGIPTRQPEFFVKNNSQVLEVELFRKKTCNSVERCLIGEAMIPVKFLLVAPDNHLIVEVMRDGGKIAATILVRVEKYDAKGRRSNSKLSHSSSQSVKSQSVLSLAMPLSDTNGSVDETNSYESSLIDGPANSSESTVNRHNSFLTHHRSVSSGQGDFIDKMTLCGSPITILKSEQTEGPRLHPDGSPEMLMEPTDGSPVVDCKKISRAKSPSTITSKGLVSLEVVSAHNLPREKRVLRLHYQNNPFVVISFGKQSFRTKVVKRTVNPVWRERLFFTVKEAESKFSIGFSVYDYDKISYNSCTGTASIPISKLIEHTNEIQKLALNLKVDLSNEGFSDACLLVKACFISQDILRRHFWGRMAKQFDHDDNGKLNRVEMATMLESIGSTLSDDTLDVIIKKLDVDIDGEIEIANIATCLEDLTVKASHPEHAEENIVLIQSCPICSKEFTGHNEDIDVITHLAICAAKDSGKMDQFVMGGFLTENYASRKWFMKLLSFMSFGGYRIGKNNGNILVQDRRTGKLLEEKMPTYIRLGIRWMHQYTASNRAVDTFMVRQIFQSLTIKQGRKFDDPSSAASIPAFIAYHGLDVDEILEPLDSFRTFNEFFYRRLKPSARRLASPDPRVCVSPADCRLNCFPTIDESTRLWIKGANFSIESLLKDEMLAKYYEGGSVIICRLAPQDYHRFHSPCDGLLSLHYLIPGAYFTVNPMAVRQRIDVFTENARTVCILETEYYGKVAFVAVGAMMVGSIVMTAREGSQVGRGDEIGYFAFGGSTIIALFPKDVIEFDEDLVENSREPLETLVQMGDSIGYSLL